MGVPNANTCTNFDVKSGLNLERKVKDYFFIKITAFLSVCSEYHGAGKTNLARVGQGPIALAVGAGGRLFWTFFLSSTISLLFLPSSGRRPDID